MKRYILEVNDSGEPVIVGPLAPPAPPVPPVVAPPVVVPPPPAKLLLPYRGANLAGGDTPCLDAPDLRYNGWPKDGLGPIDGTNYKFIPFADVQRLIDAGMNTFRVCFAAEALCPTIYQDINANTGRYKTYADQLFALVDFITSRGAVAMLDIHPGGDELFAAYWGKKAGDIFVQASPAKTEPVNFILENLWWQLATKYSKNANVWYGLANEPHDTPAATWFVAAQSFIDSIRKTGATGKVLPPGTAWTGAGTWVSSGNAKAFNLKDPLNNMAIQLHLYADANSGGGTDEIVSETILVDRCKDATEWARKAGQKLFLGEVALAVSNPKAKPAWANLMAFLNANKDVWSGYTFWAAGPKNWWGGYRFYCGPDSAQLKLIQGDLK